VRGFTNLHFTPIAFFVCKTSRTEALLHLERVEVQNGNYWIPAYLNTNTDTLGFRFDYFWHGAFRPDVHIDFIRHPTKDVQGLLREFRYIEFVCFDSQEEEGLFYPQSLYFTDKDPEPYWDDFAKHLTLRFPSLDRITIRSSLHKSQLHFPKHTVCRFSAYDSAGVIANKSSCLNCLRRQRRSDSEEYIGIFMKDMRDAFSLVGGLDRQVRVEPVPE
jgi:hypothetical protein